VSNFWGSHHFHYDILYPWKYGSGDAFVLGKESVQKSKGMEFYSVLQKTERKAMQFTSVQEALDACKGWSAK